MGRVLVWSNRASGRVRCKKMACARGKECEVGMILGREKLQTMRRGYFQTCEVLQSTFIQYKLSKTHAPMYSGVHDDDKRCG